MSLVMNMVGGGSGGISGNRAVLVARVPSGSTVTATKGGVTLTPTMWVSETYPDQDIALFVFSSSQFDSVNPWTITATDGTYSTSETVLITSNKEYEVSLNYRTYLFDNGNQCTDITGGWKSIGGGSSNQVTDKAIVMKPTSSSSAAGNFTDVTNNLVSISGNTKLCARAEVTGFVSSGQLWMGLSSNNTATGTGNMVVKVSSNISSADIGNEITLECDISSYSSGNYYVQFDVLKSGFTIYEVWLE